jgi:hypothetical protein
MLTGYAPRVDEGEFPGSWSPNQRKKGPVLSKMMQNIELTKSGLGQSETNDSCQAMPAVSLTADFSA